MITYYKEQKHSLSETAKHFSIGISTTFNLLRKIGVKIRSRAEGLSLNWKNSRSHNPIEQGNWKGGRFYDGKGYIRVYCPDHPRAASFSSSPKKRYVYEHILNWEKANGMPISKGHIVHHLNGIRDDNRPENLVVLPSKHAHNTWTLTALLEKRLQQLEPNVRFNVSKKKEGKIYRKEYVIVRLPSHHRADSSGYVSEHILNWEKANKKQTPKDSVIHHLNGIKDDNRPENLVMLPKHEHKAWTIVNLQKERIRSLESLKGGKA